MPTARSGLRLALMAAGTVAFVAGGVMSVVGAPSATTLVDAGTAAWSLAAALPVK